MHFRSTIDTSRSRTRRIQSIIFIFVNVFCFNLRKKRCSEASRFKVGSSLSFSNLEVSEINIDVDVVYIVYVISYTYQHHILNYTSLLLHLVTTHLLSHPFLSTNIFIISTLIISIFYCLNYTSLLLHLIIAHFVIDFIITVQ